MHCFKKAVCVKIASSIMPGVKMLRQNFVSASNKSPKDKRFEILNIITRKKLDIGFKNEFQGQLQTRRLDIFPTAHFHLSQKQTYCLDLRDVLFFSSEIYFHNFLFSYFYIFWYNFNATLIRDIQSLYSDQNENS